jgi:hypothetical protein
VREGRVLIIRLWLQGEEPERQLVGHMASLDDPDDPDEPETLLASVKSLDEILAVTTRWVEDLTGR